MASIVARKGSIASPLVSRLSRVAVTKRNYVSSADEKKPSIFQRLWDQSYSPITDAHSKTLTASAACYELVFEQVKPEFMHEYLEETGKMNSAFSANEDYSGELLGSWTTVYGDCDQAIHLWVYKDGYKGASRHLQYIRENKEIQDHIRKKGQWLQSKRNQLCHEFSFWGSPRPRKPSHIYELRSYDLKPGTLIEWGNKWGQAINIRREDAVGGFFSQIGKLYQVHHLWAYNDLEHRKAEREKMWQDPGWDDCVAATVPLIRQMNARVLQPTESSPMQ